MDAAGAKIIGLIVKSDTKSHTYIRSEELARRCIRLALWHLNLEALLPSSHTQKIHGGIPSRPRAARKHPATRMLPHQFTAPHACIVLHALFHRCES